VLIIWLLSKYFSVFLVFRSALRIISWKLVILVGRKPGGQRIILGILNLEIKNLSFWRFGG